MLGGDHKKNFLQYHCSTNKKRLKRKTNLLQFPLHFLQKKKNSSNNNNNSDKKQDLCRPSRER